jgi:hypothetical protein
MKPEDILVCQTRRELDQVLELTRLDDKIDLGLALGLGDFNPLVMSVPGCQAANQVADDAIRDYWQSKQGVRA